MKEQILKIKEQNPELGYRAIAKIVGCSHNLVKYYVNSKTKPRLRLKQKQLRSSQLQKLKQDAGGSCKICGYNKCFDALCFHHTDPTTKTDQVPVLLRRSLYLAEQEVKKCVLLCANCHTELHANLTALPCDVLTK